MQEKTQATNNSSVERAHSRSSLSNLTTADYQVVLRLAFVEWGLPDRLAVDHDRVFYDNLSPLPFPTRLQLWLLALGVELTFARKHRPTDQAAHRAGPPDPEGQQFVIWDALRAALDARRRFLTDRLGCASLQRTAPPCRPIPQSAHRATPTGLHGKPTCWACSGSPLT